MGTFVELFRVLDGWDTDELPERIDIKADETLAEVERLRAAGRGSDARRFIDSEIRRLRPMVRLTRLSAAELNQEDGRPEFRYLDYLARLHWLASQTLLVEGQWQEARLHLVRAVELTPEDPTPRYSLVEVYEGMGDYPSAWGLLKRTIPSEPDRFGPLFQFAQSLRRRGESERARSYFGEIRDQDDIGIFRELSSLALATQDRAHPTPDDLETLWHEGSARLDADLPDSALEATTELLSYDVTHGRTWERLGYLYTVRQRDQRAPQIPLLDHPAVGWSVPFEVASAERQDDLTRAAQAYRMALAYGGESARVHYDLANTYLDMGFPGDALKHARRAANLAPDNASAKVNLANVLMRNGELGEALTIVANVIDSDERFAAAHLVMGQILVRLGEKEAADVHVALYLLNQLGPEEVHEQGA